MTGATGQEAPRQRADPSVSDIHAQLERILDDPGLQGSTRRREMLRYLVEETLAGRAGEIKGFTVATAAFGRDDSFDAGADPLVRLEARRLRRDLDGYYMGAGRDDPVRISVPKGAYVPRFEWTGNTRSSDAPSSAADPEHDRASSADADAPESDVAIPVGSPPRTAVLAALAVFGVLLAAAGGAWYWLHGSESKVADARGPSIIVLPFEASGVGDTRVIASGLTQELIADLMRFPDFRVYSAQASFRQDASADPVGLGRDLGVAYVVKGTVQTSGATIRLGAQLADARTGEVHWSGSYDRALTPNDLLDVQGDLAAAVATELGEPFGVVSSAMSWRLTQGDAPSMPSYACVLRAYDYRRTFEDTLFAPALACLKQAVVRDPDFADAWAMLGWLHLYAVREDMAPPAEHPAHMAAAIAAASHAVGLDPRNQRGLEALSAITFHNGNYAEAERLQREALALNPYDPDTLAQLGWRLAVRGDWDNGLPYLNEAIDRSGSPPGWYFHMISVHHYLEGDYAAALAAAERSAKVGSPIGLSLAAISHAKLGDMAAARDDLAAMAEAWPLLARDPAAAYRSFQADESIIAPLVEGLRAAGWTEPDAAPVSTP